MISTPTLRANRTAPGFSMRTVSNDTGLLVQAMQALFQAVGAAAPAAGAAPGRAAY